MESHTPTVRDSFIIFIIFILVAFFIILTRDIFITSTPQDPLNLLYSTFFTHLIGILLPVLVYIRVKKYSLKESLIFNPIPVSTLLSTSLLSIIVFFALNGLNQLLEPVFIPYQEGITEYENFFIKIVSASQTPVDIILLVLSICIIPAIVEEILFRGIILTGLRNSSTSTRAVVLSGLLFGIIHFFPPQAIITSILGIFFGIMAVKSGSILTAIWCHFLNNFLIIVIVFWQVN